MKYGKSLGIKKNLYSSDLAVCDFFQVYLTFYNRLTVTTTNTVSIAVVTVGTTTIITVKIRCIISIYCSSDRIVIILISLSSVNYIIIMKK